MGFWDNLWNRTKDATALEPTSWLVDWVRGGPASTSGVTVTADTAMRQSAAVFACVRVRSEDIGKLPCIMYERQADGGKKRAQAHPLYRLIKESPNEYQTAFEFRQLLQAWVDLRGNGYALKQMDRRGNIEALWPLSPTWVTIKRLPGSWDMFYEVTIPGESVVTYTSEDILHIRGFSVDGFCGLSPIGYQRETVGLAMAAQGYGSAFFGNSAQPQGILTIPTTIGAEKAKTLRDDWRDRFQGPKNAHRLAILDGGMTWTKTGMDNGDAQWLETRKFQNSQIYALYRMPPHKVGDLDKATFSNIEQQALEYVQDCLMSEMVRWEQSLSRQLLREAERKQYFFEFMPDALLRGDFASRMAGYAVARNWGIFSANEIRERENLNHIPDGDIYLQPLNMVEAGAPPPIPAGPPAATDQPPADSSPPQKPKQLNGNGAERHD